MTREEVVRKIIDELFIDSDDDTKRVAASRITRQFDIKEGKWIKSTTYHCSVCNEVGVYTPNKRYCPNCGARMLNSIQEEIDPA